MRIILVIYISLTLGQTLLFASGVVSPSVSKHEANCENLLSKMGDSLLRPLQTGIRNRNLSDSDIKTHLSISGIPLLRARHIPDAKIVSEILGRKYQALKKSKDREIATYIREHFSKLFSNSSPPEPLVAYYYLLHEGPSLKLSPTEMLLYARHLFAENEVLFPKSNRAPQEQQLQTFLELGHFIAEHLSHPREINSVLASLSKEIPTSLLLHAKYTDQFENSEQKQILLNFLDYSPISYATLFTVIKAEVAANGTSEKLGNFLNQQKNVQAPDSLAQISKEWASILKNSTNKPFNQSVLDHLSQLAGTDSERLKSILPAVSVVLEKPERESLLPKYLKIYGAATPAAFQDFLRRAVIPRVEQNAAAIDSARHLVSENLEADKLKPLDDLIVEKFSHQWETLTPDFRSQLGKRLASWRFMEMQNVLGKLGSAAPEEQPDLLMSLVSNQNEWEPLLKERLAHIIEANAPPEPWKTMQRPWATFTRDLPTRERYQFTKKLLERQGNSTTRVTSIISNLDAIDGVKEAVRDFLRASPLMRSNRGDFSQTEVQAMFGRGRLNEFFPHIFPTSLEGPIRTKFNLAVFLTPPGLRWEWFHEKMSSDEVNHAFPEIMGFRPAMGYPRLSIQLNGNFSGTEMPRDAQSQIRGLTVQGVRMRNGHSVMERFTGQGDQQVEEEVPPLRRRMERSLASGPLSLSDKLTQRLFVTHWDLETGVNLIQEIRERAILVANADRSFWGLRVEIHNFPTQSLLNRVREFASRYDSGSERRHIINRLAQDMEKFLGLTKNSNLKRLVDGLYITAEDKESLKKSVDKKKDCNAIEELEIISELRRKFELTPAHDTQFPLIRRIKGDQEFSASAMAAGEKAVEELELVNSENILKEASILGQRLLDHVVLDDMLSANYATQMGHELKSILNDSGLSLDSKLRLTSSLLQNAVDQVSQHLEKTFGRYDLLLSQVNSAQGTPKFLDTVMRSHVVYVLQRLVDKLETSIATRNHLTHSVGGVTQPHPAEVLNPGSVEGIIRVNKNPMELTQDEIGVFENMPPQTSTLGGIITVGVGARLSHLQLLAKSLGIPNAKVSPAFLSSIQSLNGKRVRFTATPEGQIEIKEVTGETPFSYTRDLIEVPSTDHSINEPLSFANVGRYADNPIAGPKGLQLVRLRSNETLIEHVPDGFIMPFGFFKRYAENAGITELLNTLSQAELKNRYVVSELLARIRSKIRTTPISEKLLGEVMNELNELQARSLTDGFFFRSDTNIEDLPHFNGAGLNESVPNVKVDPKKVEEAIRLVWLSPFEEKSVYLRGQALGRATVSIAEPSVVVMPTVQAEKSGVMLSRGGLNWQSGKGRISANWGIGSTVEANTPVEEITIESGIPHRTSFTTSTTKPVASAQGGLSYQSVSAGEPILSDAQVVELNKLSQVIERVLGSQPHGWDIEWAIDQKGKIIILQARPNM